jgi:hypothetical protein
MYGVGHAADIDDQVGFELLDEFQIGSVATAGEASDFRSRRNIRKDEADQSGDATGQRLAAVQSHAKHPEVHCQLDYRMPFLMSRAGILDRPRAGRC